MISFFLSATLALGWQAAASSSAEINKTDSQTQKWRIGVSLQARDGAGKNVAASMPFPIDWPEQKVKILSEEKPADVKLSYKPVSGGWAKQLVVAVANLPKGQERKAVVLVEVERTPVRPPVDTAGFVL